jgi:cell division protein FtsL
MSLRVIIGVLILANLISAIGVVHARYRHRQLFVDLSRLEKNRDELNIEFSRLQLEQATWAESNRVDQIARTRLGMKTPEPADIVVIRP